MNNSDQRINQGIEFYKQPKPEGDIDLILEVRNLFLKEGLQSEIEQFYDIHPWIREAQGKQSEVQRYFLNRYLNKQLLCHPNSINERYCLIPNGSVKDWLELFTSKVLPFMVKNKLPVRI